MLSSLPASIELYTGSGVLGFGVLGFRFSRVWG